MRLTFAPRTRAVRARWLLEEAGAPYELLRGPDAPVLEDGGLILTESTAICLYLGDRLHLAPALDSPARGPYLHWLVFAETVLDPLLVGLSVSGQADETKLAAALDRTVETLGAREFAAGSSFTAADVCLASVLHLGYSLKRLDAHPTLVTYTHRHASRPAIRRAVSA